MLNTCVLTQQYLRESIEQAGILRRLHLSVHGSCLEELGNIQLAVSNSRDRTLRPAESVRSPKPELRMVVNTTLMLGPESASSGRITID